METNTAHLEAAADADLPPSTWADLVSAAETAASALFPHGTVSLLVTGDARVRELNREYRGVDEATDVLSFPGALPHIGDIAVSWPAVERQATQNGNTSLAEAVALTVHGLLHLAGYDHDTDAADEVMQQKTRELCLLAGFEVELFGH